VVVVCILFMYYIILSTQCVVRVMLRIYTLCLHYADVADALKRKVSYLMPIVKVTKYRYYILKLRKLYV